VLTRGLQDVCERVERERERKGREEEGESERGQGGLHALCRCEQI
jgi:hypothetical protein